MVVRRAALATLLLLIPVLFPAAVIGEEQALFIEPDEIRIGILYSGRKVRVSVVPPTGEDVMIRIMGDNESLALKKKGRKFGFLWMNVGEVHYESIPSVYMLRSSRELSAIAGPEELERLRIGFESLRARLPSDTTDAARKLFGDLVKLKEKDRLYSIESGSVVLKSRIDGLQEAWTEFFLPAKTPVGDYTVDAFSFHEGASTHLGTGKIHLERSSVVSSITNLVASHALLYGCLAVFIALLAGLSTGVIFGAAKGAH